MHAINLPSAGSGVAVTCDTGVDSGTGVLVFCGKTVAVGSTSTVGGAAGALSGSDPHATRTISTRASSFQMIPSVAEVYTGDA